MMIKTTLPMIRTAMYIVFTAWLGNSISTDLSTGHPNTVEVHLLMFRSELKRFTIWPTGRELKYSSGALLVSWGTEHDLRNARQ
jgi:hypothetical protein